LANVHGAISNLAFSRLGTPISRLALSPISYFLSIPYILYPIQGIQLLPVRRPAFPGANYVTLRVIIGIMINTVSLMVSTLFMDIPERSLKSTSLQYELPIFETTRASKSENKKAEG